MPGIDAAHALMGQGVFRYPRARKLSLAEYERARRERALEAERGLTRTPIIMVSAHIGVKDIEEAMAGNLCRCGTYLRIKEGIRRAAVLAAKKAGEA